MPTAHPDKYGMDDDTPHIIQDPENPLGFLLLNPLPRRVVDPLLRKAAAALPDLTEDNHPTLRAAFTEIYEQAARREFVASEVGRWQSVHSPAYLFDGQDVFLKRGPVRLTMPDLTTALLFKLSWVNV